MDILYCTLYLNSFLLIKSLFSSVISNANIIAMNILASAFSCLRVPIPLELVSRSGLAGVMGICIKISICCCLVDTLCLFCNPMDCSPQAPPKQEYWSGWPFPSSAVFRTQGSNLGLLHCRQILFRLSRLSHQGTETQKFTDFPT